MKIVFPILAAGLLILCAAGCTNTDEQDQQNTNQSSIPWNRPQSWEGTGAMGGFNPGPQGSTGH